MIKQNQNCVKKIVFPLEILSGVITFSALFNCVICYAILIIANLFLSWHLYVTVFWMPIVLVPHIVFCLGVSNLFSAISAYVKDLVNFVSVLITAGMYLSPVFFLLSAVPENFRIFMMCNPMTYSIENMRNVIIYGTGINELYFIVSSACALAVYGLGWWIFKRAKSGFADLL